MYTYAGYNEFGYLVLIDELIIPITGVATGSGKRSRRRYKSIELEYNIDGFTSRSLEIRRPISSKTCLVIEDLITLESYQLFKNQIDYNVLSTQTCLLSDDYPVASIGFNPLEADLVLQSIVTCPVCYEYSLVTLDKLLRESVFEILGINYNPIQLIGILESNCSHTQEFAYELKGRTNIESILAILRMEV